MENDPYELAQAAYRAYGETTDFKNYQGKPMPAWEDLGEQIQAAWTAAAEKVTVLLIRPAGYDE